MNISMQNLSSINRRQAFKGFVEFHVRKHEKAEDFFEKSNEFVDNKIVLNTDDIVRMEPVEKCGSRCSGASILTKHGRFELPAEGSDYKKIPFDDVVETVVNACKEGYAKYFARVFDYREK